MNSLIFRTATNVLLPVMLLLSVVVLLRGHNEPGGGFVGGLLAASGFTLYGLANGHAAALARRRVPPIALVGAGVVAATISGLPAMFVGEPFLKGLWFTLDIPGYPGGIKLGTPVLFDIGVYLVVLGGTALMALTLEAYRDDAAVGG